MPAVACTGVGFTHPTAATTLRPFTPARPSRPSLLSRVPLRRSSARHCTRAATRQQGGAQEPQQQPRQPQQQRTLLTGLAGLAGASWAGAAGAEEAAAEAVAAAAAPPAEQLAGSSGDAMTAATLDAVDALSSTMDDPTNLVISALFTVAVGALTVMTLGVAYLTFTSWMDSRTETEDRKRAGGLSRLSSGSGAAAAPAKKPKKEKEPVSSKGFGKKK